VQFCRRLCEIRMPSDNFESSTTPSVFVKRIAEEEEEEAPKEYKIEFEGDPFELLFLTLEN